MAAKTLQVVCGGQQLVNWNEFPKILVKIEALKRLGLIIVAIATVAFGQDEDVGGRATAEWAVRAYPTMSVNPLAHYNAFRAWEAMPFGDSGPVSQASGDDWISIGPDSMGGNFVGKVSGRVNAVAVHPTNPSIVYAGTSEGGIWKTTDAGASWVPLTDRQGTLQCDSLAIDPKNPNTVYAGTGSILPMLTHSSAVHSFVAYGLLKSTDGGATWKVLGTPEFSGEPIEKIIVDPASSNRVYVAATNGVWVTEDGGSTFRRLLSGFITDMELIAGAQNTLYAAVGDFYGTLQNGLFISRNGGSSWSQAPGAPVGLGVGRMEIAVAPSNTNVAYLAVSRSAPGASMLGIYKTTDGGKTWSALTNIPSDSVEYHWFCLLIGVHPANPDVVFFGGLELYRSTNGGLTWSKTAENYHVDQHCLEFAPSNADVLYLGNDGGLFRGSNVAGNIAWVDANTNICSALFYSVSTHPTDPKVTLGGLQDNGVGIYRGDRLWSNYNYADGVRVAIDQKSPSRMYYSIQYGLMLRSTSGGTSWGSLPLGLERALFMAPFLTDPVTPTTLYVGTYRVWKSTNTGSNWTPISGDLTFNISLDVSGISALAVAPSDPSRLYVGTGDGRFWTSADGGSNWRDLTGHLPDRWVSAIAVHPSNPNLLIVGLAGYGTPHLFRSRDAGETFEDVSENLSDLMVNDVEFDTATPSVIYVANEFGVLVGDGYGLWYRMGRGLPYAPVTGIAPTPGTNTVRVSTFGRGMWDIPHRRTVAVTVDLQSWSGPDMLIHFDLISPTDGSLAGSWDLLPLSGGAQITNVPNGKWLLRARGHFWLGQALDVGKVGGDGASVAFSLSSGDVNGDNRVDMADLVGVLLVYGTSALEADVTGDDAVTIQDLVVVLSSFGLVGD